MNILTQETFNQIHLDAELQLAMAKTLTSKLTVSALLTDPIVVGDAAQFLSMEVARRLKLPHYTIPTAEIFSPRDGHQHVGTISANHMSSKGHMLNDATVQGDILAQIERAREKINNDILQLDKKLLWSNLSASAKKGRNILLIEPLIVSPERFKLLVKEISGDEVASIIPATPFLLKNAVIGAGGVIKTGCYLHQCNELQELQRCLDETRRLAISTI